MRILAPTIFLLLIACSEAPVEEELGVWTDISPDPGAVLRDVYFHDEAQGWAVGQALCRDEDPCEGWRAVVFVTADGGGSWERFTVPTTSDLHRVHFLDPQHGLAFGGSVHESQDGGKTWSTLPHYPGIGYGDVEVLSGSVVWAAGEIRTNDSYAVVMRSSNLARSWEVMNTDGSRSGYSRISVPSSDVVYALGPAFIAPQFVTRSRDGGENWTDLVLPAGSGDPSGETVYYGLAFADDQWGWVVGRYGSILHTRDGGLKWERQEAGDTTRTFHDVDAFDRSHAIVSSSGGAVLETRDGGSTWREHQLIHPNRHLVKVHYSRAGIGYALGGEYLLRARLTN